MELGRSERANPLPDLERYSSYVREWTPMILGHLSTFWIPTSCTAPIDWVVVIGRSSIVLIWAWLIGGWLIIRVYNTGQWQLTTDKSLSVPLSPLRYVSLSLETWKLSVSSFFFFLSPTWCGLVGCKITRAMHLTSP